MAQNLKYSIESLSNGFNQLSFSQNSEQTTSKDSIDIPIKIDIPLEQVTILNLIKCKLRHLPPELNCLNLIELDVSFNFFLDVPDLVYRNKQLEKLNLSNNKLKHFSNEPKCSVNLKYLDLSHNELTSIPIWIFNFSCVNLESLKLSDNPFSPISSYLNGRCMKNLRSLELNDTNIRHSKIIMKLLCELPVLEKLCFSNIDPKCPNKNSIVNDSLQFVNFTTTRLTELHLIGLSLVTIPAEIVNFTLLKTLKVRNNYISWLPENFEQLTNLEIFDVSHNDLVALPAKINNLKHLRQLFVAYNILRELPSSIVELKSLEYIDCYNNDFTQDVLVAINQMPWLKGIDFEQNFFDNEDEPLEYLKKRANLREIMSVAEQRLNSSKYQTTTTMDSNSNYSKSYSDLEDEDEDADDDGQGAPVGEEMDVDGRAANARKICDKNNEAENKDANEEPEDWDKVDQNAIFDDSNLVLYPGSYATPFAASTRSARFYVPTTDPVFFEDAENDNS